MPPSEQFDRALERFAARHRNAAFEQLAPSDPATQRALFHDNAARFYGLDPAAPAE